MAAAGTRSFRTVTGDETITRARSPKAGAHGFRVAWKIHLDSTMVRRRKAYARYRGRRRCSYDGLAFLGELGGSCRSQRRRFDRRCELAFELLRPHPTEREPSRGSENDSPRPWR